MTTELGFCSHRFFSIWQTINLIRFQELRYPATVSGAIASSFFFNPFWNVLSELCHVDGMDWEISVKFDLPVFLKEILELQLVVQFSVITIKE